MLRISTRLLFVPSLIAVISLLFCNQLLAWDATGHRLSAYVAWEFMSPAAREKSITILQQHPRYETDFISAMPADIQRADDNNKQRWLFAQAAVWPDIARSFSGADELRYHHPDWHWIDGAWLRDEAIRQGNLYVGTSPGPAVQGRAAASVQRRSQADNIVTALDWALLELNRHGDSAEKAIALSWMAHLVGDIHQPLHSGSLVSARLFADGDRGGNAITLREGNLHSMWDNALRNQREAQVMPILLNIAGELSHDRHNVEFAHTRWLQQSRDLLIADVYPDVVVSEVLRSEQSGTQPASISLDEAYEEYMREIAMQRIAEAGVRLAHIMESL